MLTLTAPTQLIIDSRESRADTSRLLMTVQNLDCVHAELQVADYCSADQQSLGIERKTANDLVVSIMDRRVFSQVEQLAAQPWVF